MNTLIDTTHSELDDIFEFLMQHLGLDGVMLTVTRNERLLDRLSTEHLELRIILVPSELPHTYTLVTRTNKIMPIAFCHEMVHLMQYESGRLKMNNDDGTMTWDGTVYSAATDYFDREWEKEAESRQHDLLRAYRKHEKCNRYGKA